MKNSISKVFSELFNKKSKQAENNNNLIIKNNIKKETKYIINGNISNRKLTSKIVYILVKFIIRIQSRKKRRRRGTDQRKQI